MEFLYNPINGNPMKIKIIKNSLTNLLKQTNNYKFPKINRLLNKIYKRMGRGKFQNKLLKGLEMRKMKWIIQKKIYITAKKINKSKTKKILVI